MNSCSVQSCDRPHYAKGLCNSHWARMRRGHDLSRSFSRREWPFADRLWSRVDRKGPDECWLWTGSTTRGYGAFSIGGAQTYAHRASYILAFGPIPAGHHVCHRCDNPLCVNPSHLFAGTPRDNIDDKLAKGRQPHGSRLAQAKLREADIPVILSRLAAGELHERIAADYGVSRPAISLININATWRRAASSAVFQDIEPDLSPVEEGTGR